MFLYQEHELSLIDWHDSRLDLGDCGRVAWTGLDERHLPDDAAPADVVDHAVATRELDMPVDDPVHHVARVALAEQHLAGSKGAPRRRMLEQVDFDHCGILSIGPQVSKRVSSS